MRYMCIHLMCLCMFVGFFAFNAGSMLTLQSPTAIGQLGLIVINTLISAASGGLMATFLDYRFHGEMSLMSATNGMLSGLSFNLLDIIPSLHISAYLNLSLDFEPISISLISFFSHFSSSLTLHRSCCCVCRGADLRAMGLHLHWSHCWRRVPRVGDPPPQALH